MTIKDINDILITMDNIMWTDKTKISELYVDKSWKKVFKKRYMDKIDEYMVDDINENKMIFPYPDKVFAAFNLCKLKEIKAVIIGQDPYHGCLNKGDEILPQAMGLSFSVPKGIKIPSSLRNVYKNLEKFGHIKSLPDHGDLTGWGSNGVLLLNTALTVEHKKPNSHANYWTTFTDKIIKYISKKRNNIVFLLWGKYAYNKRFLINEKKHKIIHSTHPSGYSYSKPAKYGDAFINVDHFGKCNKYLEENEINPIKWDNLF